MSKSYKEKQFLNVGSKLAFNPNTWAMQYYDDYVGGMEIYSLDKKMVQKIRC